MEVFECKYCKSKNLVLESRVSGEDVLTANMVALKCADCGKWIKWCPKEERHFYIKEKEPIFTFTQEQLDQHDTEVRKQERQKVIAELEEWVKKYPKVEEWDNVYNVARTYIHKEDLQKKLSEMKGE